MEVKDCLKVEKREYLDDKIEIVDLKTNSIKVDATNPHQAVDFASLVYKNNLIVMGGSIKQNNLGVKQYSTIDSFYSILKLDFGIN